MAKADKNLPVDYKWTPDAGIPGKSHMFADGEYIEQPYVRQEYPKFKYHPDYVHNAIPGRDLGFTQLPQLVHSASEEAELGSDWKDSPGEVGVMTAPDAETVQKSRKLTAAQGSDWRASVRGSVPAITEAHLEFLRLNGAEVETLADAYKFLAGMTSQQMNGFLQESAAWIREQEKPKSKRA